MQAAGNGVVLTQFSRLAADLGAVYRYQEGLFVRAYNEGAYAFIHQVLACKAMRRFVKSAGPIGWCAAFRLPGLACFAL